MIVVGGGAIGVTIALELARGGAAVTLLESGSTVGAGCSSGSAGLLCPSHAAPLATRAALREGLRWSLSRSSPLALDPRPSLVPWLARFASACTPERERAATRLLRELSVASLVLHEQLVREIGVQLERSGSLSVYETERGLESGRREAAEHAESGLRAETLTGREASQLEPTVVGPIAGAIHFPDELSGDPADFVRVVGAAAEEAGVRIRTGVEVLSLDGRAGRIAGIETTAGRLAAETVILAAGVWTPLLARGLRLTIPVEGGKGYHVDYERVDSDPRLPVFIQEARVVATPLPGRLRLAGTLELTGLDQSVNRRRLAAIEQAGARRIRTLRDPRREPVEVWRGIRPCAPDGLPIVGRPARHENLVLATGHAMLGFTLAPVTAQIVTRLVLGEEPGDELALLHPDRFNGLRSSPGRRRRGGSDGGRTPR